MPFRDTNLEDFMENVRVGTGVLVIRDRKVLLGKRKGSHAAGLYSFPGGHLDFGENWVDCAKRELEEECGSQMKVEVRRFAPLQPAYFITNDIMPQYNKHYVTIFMVADWISGEPLNMEPHKCEGWDWFSFEELAQFADKDECANWIPMEQVTYHRASIGF
jgi:8-oxo-dGTP diphosphatase